MLAGARFTGFIPVRDAARGRRFYEDVLALRVVEDTPFAVVLDAGGTALRVTPVAEFTPQPFTVAGWQVTDIAAAVRGLADSGVSCVHYDGMDQDELGIWSAPGGARVAWFRDPDGNILSLTQAASG